VKKKSYSEILTTWREEGAVLIDGVFSVDEINNVQKDIGKIFKGKKGSILKIKKHGGSPETDADQFLNFENIPFDCSPALNLISVHPQLINIAKEALGTNDIRLYQAQAWAKYAGEADFEQSFHCDFGNHTLTVPSEMLHENSITFLMYFSDVSEKHGPAHYVKRTDAKKIIDVMPKFLSGREDYNLQDELFPFSCSTAGPAGTIFAYGIDIFHRATNITVNGGYRFAVTSCFKKGGNDTIGYTAWPYHQIKPWNIIFEHATPEQLNCFGVPLPGEPFWNKNTLNLAQLRYPKWNMKDYQL